MAAGIFTEPVVEQCFLVWRYNLGSVPLGYMVLPALRGVLLPKLLSGELRIKNAEKFIGGLV